MAAATLDFLVLLRTALLTVKCALGLTNEVEPLFSLGDEGPIRVVVANRRVDFEPSGQLYEQLDVLVGIEVGGKALLDLRLPLDGVVETLLAILDGVEVLEIATDALFCVSACGV